ncbi:MAG TPA: toll/interleukin-1 receptor domain-containing protein [Gemmatimonadaceae bacterium]|nr:toll/interleukin-1 receptor domain-containing protein [Gemmatimonadaceae bacterium]
MVVYVVWHPDFEHGQAIADALFSHYRRDHYTNVAGGVGLSVLFRTEATSPDGVPIPIDLNDADSSAIVVLVERNLLSTPEWLDYVSDLANDASAAGLSARVIPVTVDRGEPELRGSLADLQRVGLGPWDPSTPDQSLQLITQLTYQFCRMLRHYLARLEHEHATPDDALLQYLKPVSVFLSHSKHDDDGAPIARAMRNRLTNEDDFATFFDVVSIPAGLEFEKAIDAYVRVSALVAIQTDSFASREWCRREVLTAKRANVPIVVANCLADVEDRAFPYLGNVPTVRMDPANDRRITHVVNRLLDEVLKDFLWRCRVASVTPHAEDVFVPRPPELLTLATLVSPATCRAIIYPDPPLGATESALFAAIAPQVTLLSMTQWLAAQR